MINNSTGEKTGFFSSLRPDEKKILKSIAFAFPCQYQSVLIVRKRPATNTSYNNPEIYCQMLLQVTSLYIVAIIHPV